MNEFSREALLNIIETDHVQCGEASALARMALAALDSEPVGEFYEDGPLNWYQISDGDRVPAHRRIPLYRHAQPAPVIVDADDNFYSWFGREWHENYQHNQYTTAAKQMLGVMAESAWCSPRQRG